MNSIPDTAERELALDTRGSFCVTAPAGSGKTELLIQRYLALLAEVQRPEQILAITFTRKAAAEMRERIHHALTEAQVNTACYSAHQQVTRNLALRALAAGEARGWQLTRDLARINIKTIDSFCASLTRQMPVLSQFGGQARILDDARELYREAVGDMFDLLDSDHPVGQDLAALIGHFDNNWERLGELLTAMLARRDQWHAYIGVRGDPEAAEQSLAATVESLVAETLSETATALAPYRGELFDLMQYARANLGESALDSFPAAEARACRDWRGLRAMLLTAGGGWRKSVTVKEGFLPGKGEAQVRKKQLQDLITSMAGTPGLEQTLDELAWLPDMSSATPSWQLVQHLAHVLPMLSACLLLVFQRRGSVDHTQVALSALQALGDEDAPTELALRLDYQIEHILVDEFQDTAINQFELVTRLTRGWGEYNQLNPQQPRSLFIVGDAMQSIYGFRDANVGLFLKARLEGFNGVRLEPLTLRCNFRSGSGIVQWVNQTFSQAFPAQADIRRGRVSYSDAVAMGPEAGAAVEVHGFWGETPRAAETRWLVDAVRGALDSDPGASIALLGRTRGHLAPTLALLRAEGIHYSAQDMDALGGSPVIIDLMSLCRALANPADRVAWLALLRAPWCGLTLGDLRLVAASGNPARIVTGFPAVEGLTADGRRRLGHVAACIDWARSTRDRLALRVWLEQLWLRLGGPACVEQSRQLGDAQRFFELLEQAESEAVGLDIPWLYRQLENLYAAGEDPGARLQVMTLHKAKGLEFDWVFIPALDRGSRPDEREILLWDDYTDAAGRRGFLLAADDHSGEGEPSLYNYLKHIRKDKTREEGTRLLYVGATRAAKHLRLSACLTTQGEPEPGANPDFRDPPAGSLLATVWPHVRHQLIVHDALETAAPAPSTQAGTLVRVSNIPAQPADTGEKEAAAGSNIPPSGLNWLDRYVGTTVHEALEVLSLAGELPATPPVALVESCRRRLQRLGLAGEQLQAALQRVSVSLNTVLGDEQGRWLLSGAHPQAHSELALSWVDEESRVKDVVIDRTFVDAASGERWVVDYKTSAPVEGEGRDVFALREAAAYSVQLATYRDVLRLRHPDEPIRCALYFTAIGLFHPLPDLDL